MRKDSFPEKKRRNEKKESQAATSAISLDGFTRKRKRRENKKKGTPSKFGKRSRRGRNYPGKATEVSTVRPRGR